MCDQYKRDLESLTCEREEFMNKMAHEHDDWFGKMQQERANFLRDVEMQNRNMNILIDKRREEIVCDFIMCSLNFVKLFLR